jgi:hypothetical protein
MSIWKSIPDAPDYYASITGEILSLKKEVPLILKQVNDGKGYRVVNINKRATFVHRLIGCAFLGLSLKNSKDCIMHLDDDPKNNNLSNLRLGSQLDNLKDMRNKGRNYKASARFNQADLHLIRTRLANGERGSKLAKEYDVSASLISAIKNNHRYV